VAWKSYDLDRRAQTLVLAAKQRDKESLNQAYKMRSTVAFGLERFWGEHLRLRGSHGSAGKADYWQETWDTLVDIMRQAGVTIPNDAVQASNPKSVQAMAEKLWALGVDDQRVAIAVLTQLCDCMIWWTQRYK